MARPSSPMLSRPGVVAAALQIIDAEGLAACSTPRLAREFGVRAPSLYHHFSDRAEIMTEVARLVIRETTLPVRRDDAAWEDWFVSLASNFRRTILRHPNVAPILLEYLPRDILGPMYDRAARVMTEAGIPVHLHALILDGLETLTLGAALMQASKSPETRLIQFPALDRESEPTLAAAVDANPWTSAEDAFVQVIRSFLRGVLLSADVTLA